MGVKKEDCSAFEINYDTVYARSKARHEDFETSFIKVLQKGYEDNKLKVSLETYKELEMYFKNKGNISEDYVSIDYLCRLWGIDRKTFNDRKSLGWDLRHILEGSNKN